MTTQPTKKTNVCSRYNPAVLSMMLFLVLSCVSHSSYSQEGTFYGVAGAGYAQTEIENFELDKAAYHVSIGYELSEQWVFEAGFISLGQENAGDPISAEVELAAEVVGVQLSALGRAQGKYGELFYRIGVAQYSLDIQQATSQPCQGAFETRSVNGISTCLFDDSVIAGHVGLGFDFFLNHSTFLRTELQYHRGENDFESTLGMLSIRVNF